MAQTNPPNPKNPTDSQIIARFAKTGTAMRALIDEQARKKRRVRAVKLLIGFIVFLIIFYLAVTTFIFNPIEPGVIAFYNAVPKNCEFFARKADLAADFPLPPTVMTPGTEEAVLWHAFQNGKLGVPAATVQSWMQQYDTFVKSLEGTPIDPLRDLFGKEVCVAGRFADKGGLDQTRFCVYLRVGWRIRALMGFVKYDFIRNKFIKDIKIETLPSGIWKVSPPGSPKDFFVYRTSDLLMVASDEDWIKEVNNLLIDKEGSFGLTTIYAEDIRKRLDQRVADRSAPSNMQLYINLDEYRKAAKPGKQWYDPASPILEERVLASVFHPEFVKDLAAVIRFEKEPRRRIAFDLTCRTDGEKLQPFGRKLLQDKWDQQLTTIDVRLAGEMIPQAAFGGGAAAISAGDLARALESHLTVEDRRMFDAQVKSAGRFDSTRALADEIGNCLGDRAIMVFRENNYPHEDQDPADNPPDPAVAMVFPQRDPGKIRALMDFVKNNRTTLGVSQVMTYDIDRIYKLMEYYINQIPGNGEIAALPVGADTSSNFFISNQAKLIKNIHRMWAGGSQEEDRPYGIDSLYKDLLAEEKGRHLNAMFFLNGPKFSKALKKYTEYWMGETVEMTPEQMTAQRPKVFERILKEKYPNYNPQTVTDKIREEIEHLVDDDFDKRRHEAKSNISPQVKQQYDDMLRHVASVPGAAATLQLEAKRARVYVNIILE
ncbi:MAG: hypothetical protein HY286_00450 [Planctomycetes bacterium]|nr:hypothetical protein [Planctomycetota bacterium]